MNKLILSEDLAKVAAAGAFPGSVPQKPLSALTTLKSFFHMGWVPTEEGFRELMLRVIADEQHAAAAKAQERAKAQKDESVTPSNSSQIPSVWPSANVNGSTADDNKGWGHSNDNGYWAATNSTSPVHENNNCNCGPESAEAFWVNHNEDCNYGGDDYWGGGYDEGRDGPRSIKNQWDVDNDDGNCNENDSWGFGYDEGRGGSASTSKSSQDSSDDDDSDSTGTQDDTPTSSSSALNQDLVETITALKQAIINLPARIAGVDQNLDKSQETTANVAEGMGSELKSQLDEKNAELLRLQTEIDALRQKSQQEILRCELEIIDLHTNSGEVQQELTDFRVKDRNSEHQIANLRSKDAESQQEIKNLRAQNAESRREVHRLLRVIRDEAPETFCREVMQDRFLDNMFRDTADRRDTAERRDTFKQEATVDLDLAW
ncbi:hypothetical protein BJ166DRAFT_540590 [Pestalotiopsis sp. NC0098]|nr:hypothetical protein BJ166DRAFT_540590 [Pestalotiopsis sp. NC0098]